jgi:succinoglycan biosynthesis transport protein ExoP
VLVTVYTFTATPIYEARAQLLIESDERNVLNFKEVVEQDRTALDYSQTQQRLLQSRTLAKKTLDTLMLWSRPEFGGRRDDSFSMAAYIAAASSWVEQIFRSSRPDDAAGPTETAIQSAGIDAFLGSLTVSPIRNSRLLDVRFRSSDPDLAARVANELVRQFIEQNLEFKSRASKEASDFLAQRLEEQRKQVEASDLALQRYREQNSAISLDERQNIVVQKLADLNEAVTQAKTTRIQKEAAYNQLRELESDRAALDTFPAILSNSFIQQLKSELSRLQSERAQLSDKLGDKHPSMVKVESAIESTQARLDAELTKVVQSVRNEYLAAQVEENSLTAALNAQKGDALQQNRKAIDYGVLQRAATSNQQIFDGLLQRSKETGISGELKASDIRIVDGAEVPRTPVRPRKQLNLLFALFGGGVLALGFAFFLEYLDNRIKLPEEIVTHLGLACLGLVPMIPRKPRGPAPLINEGVPPNFSEAFKGLRTNLLFSSAEEGSRSLVVTSAGPGEGKTIVSTNLAMALAQAGQRVILVDADMRRPQTHDVLGQEQEPGLSNLIVGNVKASEAVRPTAVAGLWVLPAGRIPPNPAELLGSPRFRDFLATLRDHFDWVIVDSPPVMAVTDAAVVAHLVNGVVFVVSAETTGRATAQTAIGQLEAANVKVMGAVLNGVNLDRNGYYYANHYRREYGAYYIQSSEA